MKRKLLTSTATLALIMAPMAPVFAQDSGQAGHHRARRRRSNCHR
ncbi:hypothetical protein [Oricola nitratireducens]|nr:hypothetical protein [Oricola nitratireducens]